MSTEISQRAPQRADQILECWLSGQNPEADMVRMLGEDDLLRRRFEKRLQTDLDHLAPKRT